MTGLFNDNGCLSDAAFEALIHNRPLDDLERLEIAEHLSFCDACTEKYARLLDESLLISPVEPVAPTVMQRIRQRARKLFVNKYATVVAAASFAIIFWNLGVFSIDVKRQDSRVLDTLVNGAASFSQRTTELSDSITQTLNKIFQYRFEFERGTNSDEKK